MADLKSVFDFFISIIVQLLSFLSSVEFWFSDIGSVSLLDLIFGGMIISAVIGLFYKGARI